MIRNTFNRYIWLLNILLQRKKMTFKEIEKEWSRSSLGNNSPLPRSTFNDHKAAIEELFDIEIKCDLSNNYHYYISNPENILNDITRKWLLNSFSLSNMITASHDMKGRILLEDIPCGAQYLQVIIESIQQGKVIKVDYQPFGQAKRTYHIETYATKIYKQRWYIVGNDLGEKEIFIRCLALDRIQDLQMTDLSYSIPESFDVERYYENTIGVYVKNKLKPQQVRIRVYGTQIDYLRTLPLHHTQKEVAYKQGEYCEFQYYLCLNPELYIQLLGMGDKVEVLEPKEMRDEMKSKLKACIDRYST